jgi:hypothetical protein
MLGFDRAVAEQRAYLAPGRIGCEGENILPTVANSVAICKNIAGRL